MYKPDSQKEIPGLAQNQKKKYQEKKKGGEVADDKAKTIVSSFFIFIFFYFNFKMSCQGIDFRERHSYRYHSVFFL